MEKTAFKLRQHLLILEKCIENKVSLKKLKVIIKKQLLFILNFMEKIVFN